MGAELVAIAPQLPAKNAEVREKHKLDFPILSDRGNAWARELGLVFAFPQDLRDVYLQFDLDLPAHNGDDSWELPMPARLVVDRGGMIRDLEVDPDYTVRPEPEATLAALERLG